LNTRRDRWDARYADGDWADVEEPAGIVSDALARLPDLDLALADHGGLALDLACGAGRNARFLARRGWRVVGADLSMKGLRRMDLLARREQLPVLPVLADAGRFEVRPGAFDLVVNTWFLLRSSFPLLRNALRPGGILLFETFSVLELDELGGDIRRAFALERGELLRAFPDFEILLHEEGVFEQEEGERGLARMIARKPG
jgi:tellurite methyltransferase